MFHKFLLEQGLLDKFAREFKRLTGGSPSEWIKHRGTLSQAIALMFAFPWEDTEDGFVFWEKENESWIDFLALHDVKLNRYIHSDDANLSLNRETLKDIHDENN